MIAFLLSSGVKHHDSIRHYVFICHDHLTTTKAIILFVDNEIDMIPFYAVIIMLENGAMCAHLFPLSFRLISKGPKKKAQKKGRPRVATILPHVVSVRTATLINHLFLQRNPF